MLILITDAPPGGTNDVRNAVDVQRMHDVALQAKPKIYWYQTYL